MWWMKRSVSSFLWVLFHALITDSLASVTPELCESFNASQSGSVKSNDGVCYFAIQGANLQANSKLNESHWAFNVSVARLICASQNATLPIFDDEHELSFVLENYRAPFDSLDVAQLALGLQKFVWREKQHQRWDDGTNVGQFKETSVTDLISKAAYALLPMTRSHGEKVWHWYSSKEAWTQPVTVLCQRRQSQLGKIRLTNMCMTPVEYFPEVHKQARIAGRVSEDMCLFVVTGSSILTNEKIGEEYVYNMEKAEQLCENYRATLPTVFDVEECNSLSFRIGHMHTIEERYGTISALAETVLWMAQEASTDGFTYKWETGDDILFEGEWLKKYAENVYTKVKYGTNTCVWENVLTNESAAESPLLTICQQRLTKYKPSSPIWNTVSLCSTDSTREGVSKKVMFENVCYFQLWGGPAQKLGILIANDECAKFGGVLPTISSDQVNVFFAKTFQTNGDPIILGLRQVRRPDEYRWIDGSPLSYEPPKWEARDSYAYATILVPETGEWKNVRRFHPISRQWIVCKEVINSSNEIETLSTPKDNKTLSTATTQALSTSGSMADSPRMSPPTKPPYTGKTPHATPFTMMPIPSLPLYGEPCDEENDAIYGKAKYLKTDTSHICYFVIPGATYHMALLPLFEIDKARKICSEHLATLPILFTPEEAEFVAQTFKEFDFDSAPLSKSSLGSTIGIALNMDVMKSTNEQQRQVNYTWHGDIPLNYEPLDWRDRDMDGSAFRETAQFVFMRFGTQVIWETTDAHLQLLRIAVLCERRLEPKSELEEGTSTSGRKFASISLVLLGCLWCMRFLWHQEE